MTSLSHLTGFHHQNAAAPDCLFVCFYKTDQMAEGYRVSASGSVDLGFDSESGQTNDFKIGIYSFPA